MATPYLLCGSEISWISAPSDLVDVDRLAHGALRLRASRPGAEMLAHQAELAARRAACRSFANSAAPARSSDVESRGSCPAIASSSSAASSAVRAKRADLVEAAGERHQAVAAHAAVGRLHARRRRTARPAGGSSRRCRCRSPAAPCRRPRTPPSRRWSRRACGSGPTGCASFERPSSRSSRPWRTRPCSSGRSARRRPP